MSEWWTKAGDAVSGPFSIADLRASVKAGRIKDNTLVRHGDSGEFRPVREVDAIYARPEPDGASRKRKTKKRSAKRSTMLLGAIVVTALVAAGRIAIAAAAMLVLAGSSSSSSSALPTLMLAAIVSAGLGVWLTVLLWRRKAAGYRASIAIHALAVVYAILQITGLAGRAGGFTTGIVGLSMATHLVAMLLVYGARHELVD